MAAAGRGGHRISTDGGLLFDVAPKQEDAVAHAHGVLTGAAPEWAAALVDPWPAAGPIWNPANQQWPAATGVPLGESCSNDGWSAGRQLGYAGSRGRGDELIAQHGRQLPPRPWRLIFSPVRAGGATSP